jgi:hypothetical protein
MSLTPFFSNVFSPLGRRSSIFSLMEYPKVQKIYRALAQNMAEHYVYEIVTPIGLVPHSRIGSVWAADPSGKPSSHWQGRSHAASAHNL